MVYTKIFQHCKIKLIELNLCYFTAGLLLRAEGLAIITVAKIGFLVTARGGSGIVIAKLKGGGK